jgi:hypothetical protein
MLYSLIRSIIGTKITIAEAPTNPVIIPVAKPAKRNTKLKTSIFNNNKKDY